MKKIVATVMLAATAAVFAPPAIPQIPNQAMALNTSASQEITAAAVQARNAVTSPATLGAGMLSSASRADAASWMPSLKGPEPAFAWVFALGFLGLVITRRIRSSGQF